MNTAIFASSYYPHLGGVEEAAHQLARAQQNMGSKPLVLTNRWPKSLPASEVHDGVPVRRFVFRVPAANLRQLPKWLLFMRTTLHEVCAQLSENNTGLLHVQCVSNNAYYALHASRRLRLPLVVTLQGELTMDAEQIYSRSPFLRRLLRTVLKEADAVTACSRQTLEEAEAFLGTKLGRRGSVVYNGISLADFAGVAPHRHPRPYVLAIGRHVPQKGFDVLLDAYARVLRDGATSHDLLLAGVGPETLPLKALAAQLGIAERVVFLGRVEHAESVKLFLGCSFFVLPSQHEPLGIVNLEAMAAGKAVVAMRVGGVPEIVHENVNGLLVRPSDEENLASSIARLISDEGQRGRLGAAGRIAAQGYDWGKIAGEYDRVYAQAVARSARRYGTGNEQN